MSMMQAGSVGTTAAAKKASMSEIKLRRLTELNARLREDLDRPRVAVSEACTGLLAYVQKTTDHMVPSVWGAVDKSLDPYTQQATKQAGMCGCF